jgi:hypothetical protein
LRRKTFFHVINPRFFLLRKVKLFKQIADLQIVFSVRNLKKRAGCHLGVCLELWPGSFLRLDTVRYDNIFIFQVINIRVSFSTLSVCLYLSNAALLARAVIIKLTRKRERDTGERRSIGGGSGEGEIGE